MGSSVILPSPGQPDTGPDPSFKTEAVPNLVSFEFRGIAPPVGFYIQRDDLMSIRAVSSLAGESVSIQTRILLPVGPKAGQPDQMPETSTLEISPAGNSIIVSRDIFTVPGTRVNTGKVLQFMEGYLLSVIAGANLATFRGQTYVSALLNRNSGGGPPFALSLFGDYVASNTVAYYPGGRVLHPTEGPGWSHSIQQANPAAGADWTLTMAAGQRVLVKDFTAQLLTSAAAGNRNIELIIDDGVNVVWRTSAPASVIAATTQQVSGTTTNNPTGVVTTDFALVIPPNMFLEPGWRIRTATTGIQAGDQWSNIWFGVEEWLDNV